MRKTKKNGNAGNEITSAAKAAEPEENRMATEVEADRLAAEATRRATIAESATDGIAAAVRTLWLNNVDEIQKMVETDMKARVAVAVTLGFNQLGQAEAQIKLSYGFRYSDETKVQIDDPNQLPLGIETTKA